MQAGTDMQAGSEWKVVGGAPDYRDRGDEELVQAILARDRSAFDELYRRYRPRVFGLVSRRVTDFHEAEDVTQEIFLQVYRSLRRYEGRSSLLTWIFGIANNQVFRYYRRRAATPVPTEGWCPFSAVNLDRRCFHPTSASRQL